MNQLAPWLPLLAVLVLLMGYWVIKGIKYEIITTVRPPEPFTAVKIFPDPPVRIICAPGKAANGG
jgi:hypothetical protein